MDYQKFIEEFILCVNYFRYELPQPAAGKMTDLAAWTECVDNSMAQLEHQATRFVFK